MIGAIKRIKKIMEHIKKIKEYVPQALAGIAHLMIAEDDRGCPVAFMGIEDGTLEMLFISPEERGKGLGKRLLQYGIKTYAVERVAVNEQNRRPGDFMSTWAFRFTKGQTWMSRAIPIRFYICVLRISL